MAGVVVPARSEMAAKVISPKPRSSIRSIVVRRLLRRGGCRAAARLWVPRSRKRRTFRCITYRNTGDGQGDAAMGAGQDDGSIQRGGHRRQPCDDRLLEFGDGPHESGRRRCCEAALRARAPGNESNETARSFPSGRSPVEDALDQAPCGWGDGPGASWVISEYRGRRIAAHKGGDLDAQVPA